MCQTWPSLVLPRRDFSKCLILRVCSSRWVDGLQSWQDVAKNGDPYYRVVFHPLKCGENSEQFCLEDRITISESPGPLVGHLTSFCDAEICRHAVSMQHQWNWWDMWQGVAVPLCIYPKIWNLISRLDLHPWTLRLMIVLGSRVFVMFSCLSWSIDVLLYSNFIVIIIGGLPVSILSTSVEMVW